MSNSAVSTHNPVVSGARKKDADYVFYELTRSICPNCKKVIDAKILLRDNKVFMAKRCPDCGPFAALVYGDAEAYTSFSKFNKPGTIPAPSMCDLEVGFGEGRDTAVGWRWMHRSENQQQYIRPAAEES